jgi:hypothetical protein
MSTELKLARTAHCIILVAMLTMAVGAAGQVETIDATARGTSTQMGSMGSVKVTIQQFSTPEDRQKLVEAFKQGQSQALADALSKMDSAGRIQTPGTVGYALAYAVTVPTPTGRKIRFVTNRRIAYGEVAQNTRSRAFNLTAGEIDINDQDAKKSTGVLYPATQLTINKDGDLQWELNQNPWQLTNIIDWRPKEKE